VTLSTLRRDDGEIEDKIVDFTYTETQDMIRDTLSRFLSDTYDFETRQKFINSDSGLLKSETFIFSCHGLIQTD